MIAKGQPIAYSDLVAIAALAHAKTGETYEFTPFGGEDAIGMVSQIIAVPTYGSGSFNDGSSVKFRLYPYKVIGGKKTYLWNPIQKVFKGTSGLGVYSITWTWTVEVGGVTPDGYVAVVLFSATTLTWQDAGNVLTLSETGLFDPPWTIDDSLQPQIDPTHDLPCGNGTWLKTFCRIHADALGLLNVFGGAAVLNDNLLTTGPEVVSAGPKCYLHLNGFAIYKSLKFIYSEADSTTGNQLALESETFNQFIQVFGGSPNNFSFDRNVKVNGIIRLLAPLGEVFADWTLTASHPGIAITFNPNYTPPSSALPSHVSAFVFTFTDVQFTVGTPIVLTANPPGGHNLFGGSEGGLLNIVMTGDISTFTAVNTTAIHMGSASVPATVAKSVDLAADLAATVFSAPGAAVYNLDTHYRVFCNGLFAAFALPSLGTFSLLDVDLPQYINQSGAFPSSRRQPILNSVTNRIQSVPNRAALWPVRKQSDFTPDSLLGQPFSGSVAFNALARQFVDSVSNPAQVLPSGVGGDMFFFSIFVPAGAVDLRFLCETLGLTVYGKANTFPSISDFDVTISGGAWGSLATLAPGFATNTLWYFGLYNPSGVPVDTTFNSVVIESEALPNGTFFKTGNDENGAIIPALEGKSFHIPDRFSTDLRPIPQVGYCVYSINIRRKPVENANGIATAPSVGTADLDIDLGVQRAWGYATAGTFEKIGTITIPAGQPSVTQSVFLPVLAGNFLTCQTPESVFIRAAVNFQPIMRSLFFPQAATLKGGGTQNVGYYDGQPWYDADKMMLFFGLDGLSEPILTPISASAVADLVTYLTNV